MRMANKNGPCQYALSWRKKQPEVVVDTPPSPSHQPEQSCQVEPSWVGLNPPNSPPHPIILHNNNQRTPATIIKMEGEGETAFSSRPSNYFYIGCCCLLQLVGGAGFFSVVAIQRDSLSSIFLLVCYLGIWFCPRTGREGGGWVSFSSLLLSSAHLTSPHRPLLPRLSIGSGPVTAIAAVLPCPPRGAHHQVCLHFPIA